MYQFKAKDPETKPYLLCLSHITKGFTIDNKEKTGLYKSVKVFSAEYNAINTGDSLDIQIYLKEKT